MIMNDVSDLMRVNSSFDDNIGLAALSSVHKSPHVVKTTVFKTVSPCSP